MSRTYRKQASYPWSWRNPLEELVDGYEPGNCIAYYSYNNLCSWTVINPKSKEGRKRLARARRDKVYNFKEPGPSWFRNLFSQRPYRQAAKREIQKYLFDTEYEPMILRKPKLEYWT